MDPPAPTDLDDAAALRQEVARLRSRLAQRESWADTDGFFQRLCTALPAWVYVYDLARQRVVYTNRASGQAAADPLPGAAAGPPADLPDDTLAWLVHPEDLRRVQAHLHRLAGLADGERSSHEFRLRDEVHGWRWCEATDVVLHRDEAGRVRQVAGFTVDITDRKQAQDALHPHRSGPQVERLPMAVIEFDVHGVVYRWSGEAERLFGWRADEVLGRPVRELDLIHDADRDGVREVVDRLWGGTDHVTWTNRNFTKDRRVVHCTWHNSRRPADDGGPGRVLSLVLDVTAQKQAEAALRASEERHRRLAETLQQGVVHQDAEGRIIAMNPAAERILGKSRERLLGSDSVQEEHDIVKEDGSLFPGESHPAMRALRDGQPVPGVVMGVWNPRRAQRRWLRVDAVPVWRDGHPAAGWPDEVYTLFEDITEQRRNEEALRQSHRRLALAMEVSRIAAFEQDLSLRYTWVHNPIVDAPDLLGRTDADLWERPEDAVRLQALKQAVVDSGVGCSHEVTIRMHGVDHEFDLHIEPLRDGAGTICGVTCAAIDIGERKRIERALREADHHKDLFIATLAHELRNPLAPILHAATVLRRHAADGTPAARSSAIIERQAAQMTRLLDDLLDVARVASGRLQLRPQQLLLATIVEQAVETARPLIDDAGHTLSVRLPDRPVTLLGDGVRLAQVCANLLTNAAKYTPAGGRIDVEARVDDGEVEISVRDSGIGLAAEHLHSVFEMFGQVERSNERSQGGMGIGLALARGLVEMHDGRIAAHSAGAGFGSVFTLRLPLPADAVAATGAPAAASEPAATAPPAWPRRILVVDDNQDAAHTLALLLSGDGHQVETAHDGAAALARAIAWRPEVALLDLGLPGLSGLDVCRALRDLPGGADLLVVAISGWGQERDRRRTAEAGFDAHLVKPVRHDQLLALLARRAPHAAA